MTAAPSRPSLSGLHRSCLKQAVRSGHREMARDAPGASALPCDQNARGVAPERAYVVLHIAEREALVLECIVPGGVVLVARAQLFAAQEAKNTYAKYKRNDIPKKTQQKWGAKRPILLMRVFLEDRFVTILSNY